MVPSNDPLYFCVTSYSISLFHSWFWSLFFSKHQLLILLTFSIFFPILLISILYFIYFIISFVYFLLSTWSLVCSSLTSSWNDSFFMWYLPFNIHVYQYKLPCKYWFCCIPHMFVSCVFIFVRTLLCDLIHCVTSLIKDFLRIYSQLSNSI